MFILVDVRAQNQSLIYVPGKIDRLIDKNGNVFFEALSEYELVNSDLSISFGTSLYHQSFYSFSGFPILAKVRAKDQYVLLDSQGEKKAWFPQGLKAVSKLREGFYLASFEVNHNIYQETRFQFVDLMGKTVFSQKGFSKASYFSEGVAPVRIDGKGWDFINDLGHELNIISDSLKLATHISSFNNGLSLLTLSRKGVGNQRFISPYFIDKKGTVVLDIGSLFPKRNIMKMSEFKGGVAAVETEWPKSVKYSGFPVAFIDLSGKIVLDIDNIIDYRISESGYIGIIKRENNGENNALLFNTQGKQLTLPKGSTYIKPLGQDYFYIATGLGSGNSKSYIYDANKMKVAYPYPTGGEILAMFENKAILKDANGAIKFFDFETQNEIMISNSKELRVINLDQYKGKLSEITNFYCSKNEWISKIAEMTSLEELTLSNLNIVNLPEITNKSKLKLLRIANCSSLLDLDIEITNLNQISLRACASLQNVVGFVKNQINLNKLFIVDMDLSQNDKSDILSKMPNAVIKGNAKSTNSEFQEVIYGF